MWNILAPLLLVIFPSPGAQDSGAQPGAQEGQAPTAPATPEQRSLAALEALNTMRAAKEAALRDVREQIAALGPGEDKGALVAEAGTLLSELEQIKVDYAAVATSLDIDAFDARKADAFDLESELQELIRPIVEELKTATEGPRQIERLRSQVAHLDERSQLAEKALENIKLLLSALPADDPRGLRRGLETARENWEGRLQDINGQKAVAHFQLEKRLADRSSFIESTQGALANFFRTRGLNLALGILTFILVLTVLRALRGKLARRLKRKDNHERHFYARLLDVLYFLFVGFMALTASLLVLYATGDWVLLGLAIFFLIGIAWTSKNAVPLFLEQIRLLLNLGAVRERERVVLDGIPYRVSKLSFYTLLSNSDLAGGVRRLPIRDLIEMRSRVASKDEVWFPCKRGDWIRLPDGTRGVVIHQSPDTVQLETPGASRVTFPATQFLELSPKNLSWGFRIQVRFGIDYAHQAICTTEVPRIFAADTRKIVESSFGADNLLGLRVEFLEAGASSLDYALIVDMAGAAAPDYDAIPRAIQRGCVETCNREGWVIPFTQVTIHQAATAEGQ